MVREIVTNFSGYSINEVLATDIDALNAVLLSNPHKSEDEVVDLLDFVKNRSHKKGEK